MPPHNVHHNAPRIIICMAVILTLLLSGCGGGGGTAGPVTSTLSFPLQSGMRASIENASSTNYTVSGTCNGTASIVSSTPVSATFEGVSGLFATTTTIFNFTDCSPATVASASTDYFDTNYIPLGAVDADGSYSVYSAPASIPVSVKVGDAGTIGTQNNYSDNTKITATGHDVISYAIEPDTASTAIVNMINKSYDSVGMLTSTEQDRYRISSDGTLSFIASDIQFADGTTFHLTFTAVPSPAPGANWNIVTNGNSINGVVWSGSKYIAVGSKGLILTSPDGVSWTNHRPPTSLSLNGIAYSGTTFVTVVGDSLGDGFGSVFTSPDGVTWTSRSAATNHNLKSVVWSGTQFVAVGWAGAITTSPDGINWTLRNSGSSTYLNAITWSGTQFVVVGSANEILTSPDGITWTAQSSGVYCDFFGISWSGFQFVAVGNIGTILTSPNGINWTLQTPPQFSGVETFSGITWSGGLYAIVEFASGIHTSPDGITWTHRPFYTSGSGPNNVYWSGTQFVATGGGIATSSDGLTWNTQVAPNTNSLLAVTWSGTQFVAVGSRGAILTSSDGISWTSRVSGTIKSLLDVTWSGTQFVAVGSAFDGVNQTIAVILTSPDGITWTNRDPGISFYSLHRVSWAGALGRFVAVGDNGTILTSPDGITWTTQSSGVTTALRGVVWSGSKFVAVGYGNTVLRSPDGFAWTLLNPGSVGDAFHSIAWTGSQFVAVGYDTTTAANVHPLTSPDGITWTRRNLATTNTSINTVSLNDIAWLGNQLVAVGWGGWILSSPDGLTWTNHYWESTWTELSGVAGNDYRFVAVGADGTILTSP